MTAGNQAYDKFVTVGVRYCTNHHGLMEEDMSTCDMVDPTDDTPCDLRMLGYHSE